MELYVDLHTHTTASDGSMSPEELVRHAKENNLAAIAVTDHDTVDGIEAALVEAKKVGIEIIPGIEISTDYTPEMHILGYFNIENYSNIRNVLISLRNGRDSRNIKIINRLNELGMAVTIDEVREIASGDIVGRPHIARALVQKGYVKSMGEAFEKYLSSRGSAYFKRFELKPEDGLKEIINAGGVPVLAHPVHLGLSYGELDELLSKLCGFGLKGIEAYYVDNTQEDTGNFLRMAKKHNLLVTGGSDFHGSYKLNISIGRGYGNLKVPYALVENLKEVLSSKK